MTIRKLPAVALALIVASFAVSAHAAEAGGALDLAKGPVTETGHIKGKESVEYTFQGRKGQALHVKNTSASDWDYFDVLPPGGGEPLFIGARTGSEYTGTLPADGEYKLQVHLSGYGAYKNEEADYSLAIDLK